MDEYWRIILYYPLGLLPAIFFGLRVLVQWYESERHKRSMVTPIFWKLSLVGNLLQMIHFFVQVQYPFAMLQAGSAMISWRNLTLMRNAKKISTNAFVLLLLASLLGVTLLFVIQTLFVSHEMDWFRTPTNLWDEVHVHHHFSWHILGTVGGILFASRFWIQWWQAERSQKSELNKSFWWISISGSVLSLIYFFELRDAVSVVQFGFGLIPYFRNIALIRQRQAS